MAPISDSERKIKDMLEGIDVPFNPEHWDKASALLDQQKGRRRRGVLLWLLSALALVGTATTVVWLINDKEKEGPMAQNIVNTASESQNNTNEQAAQNEESAQHTDIVLPGTEEQTEKTVEKTERKSNFPMSRPEMRQGTKKQNTGESENKPATQKGKSASEGGEITENPGIPPLKPKKENNKPINNTGQGQNPGNTGNDRILPKDDKPAEKGIGTDKPAIADQNSGVQSKNDTAAKLVAKSDTASILDTVEQKTDEEKPSKRLKIAPETLLGIYAGVNYTRNIQSTTVEADYTTNFTGGLFFRNTIKGRLGFGLSLGYSGYTTSGLSKTFVSKTYSFGHTQDSTVILPQKIQVMDMMALIYYGTPKTGNLVVGVNLSLIVAAHSQLSNVQESTLTGSTSSARNENGYMNGFNNSSAMLNIGYERKWKERWRYGVMLQTGLGSFVNRSYYNNVNTYNNFRLQFYLGYGIKFR